MKGNNANGNTMVGKSGKKGPANLSQAEILRTWNEISARSRHQYHADVKVGKSGAKNEKGDNLSVIVSVKGAGQKIKKIAVNPNVEVETGVSYVACAVGEVFETDQMIEHGRNIAAHRVSSRTACKP